MSNPDQSKMKQDCETQRECMEMLQMIVDGEATPEQKEHFFKIIWNNVCPVIRIIIWK